MSNLALRGLLSVEEMNALFEERLRVNLPGGSFKVIQHGASGTKVYESSLSLSMLISLEPEAHILPLNPAPHAAANDDRTGVSGGCRAN